MRGVAGRTRRRRTERRGAVVGPRPGPPRPPLEPGGGVLRRGAGRGARERRTPERRVVQELDVRVLDSLDSLE